jgi:predicted RNase H-like nuclease
MAAHELENRKNGDIFDLDNETHSKILAQYENKPVTLHDIVDARVYEIKNKLIAGADVNAIIHNVIYTYI